MLLVQQRVSRFVRDRLLGSSLSFVKASMRLKSDAVDRFCAARPVPLPLQQENVSEELQRLKEMGTITSNDPMDLPMQVR